MTREIDAGALEKAARAVERHNKSPYGWSDDEFETWWSHDSRFNTKLDVTRQAKIAISTYLIARADATQNPAPAAMPGVEEMAAALFHAESEPHNDETGYGDVYGWDDVMPAVRSRHLAGATAILALFQPAFAALAQENERLKAERDRIERNRDMWKGQCDRQAETLRELRMRMLSDEGQHRQALASVREEERERAAKICDTQSPNMPDREDHSAEYRDGFSDGTDAAASYFASAIRAGERS